MDTPCASQDTTGAGKPGIHLFGSAREFIFLGQITGNISISTSKYPKFLTALHKVYCILIYMNMCFVTYIQTKYIAVKVVEQKLFQPEVVVITSYVAYFYNMWAYAYSSHRFQHSIDLYIRLVSKIAMPAFQTPYPTRKFALIVTIIIVGTVVVLSPGLCLLLHFGVLTESSGQAIMFNQFPGPRPFQWTCFVFQLLAMSSLLYQCAFLLLLLNQCNLAMDEWVSSLNTQSWSEVIYLLDLHLAYHDNFHQVLAHLNKYWGLTYFWLMLFTGTSTAASYYLILLALPVLYHDPIQTMSLILAALLGTFLILLMTYPGIRANNKLNDMVTLLFQKVGRRPSKFPHNKMMDKCKEAKQTITGYMTYTQLVRNPIKIGNTIDLTREAVLGFWATLATYLVVMLQSQPALQLTDNVAYMTNTTLRN